MLAMLFLLSALTACGKESGGDGDDTPEGTLNGFEAAPKYYSLIYENSENGKLIGELEQTVRAGEDGRKVRASANKGYVFVGWSDGATNATRTDKNVYADVKVQPIFVKSGTAFSVTYEARMDGKVIDTAKLSGKAGKALEYIPPQAPFAYTYEWSDGTVGAKHSAGYLQNGETIVVEIVPRSLNSVPTIEIYTEDGSGITSKYEYTTCRVTLLNAGDGENFENLTAQIRGRGNSSWTYPKKGFKLKFDKKQSMLGSDYALKNWVFISNYGDKSLIRNMIGYDMSAAMNGLEYTVMHEFIDVYLDGEYYGLFMMCDRIDEKEGRLGLDAPISEDPAEMGYIIEIGMTDRQGTGKDSFSAARDKNRSYSVSFPDPDDPDFKVDVHLEYIKNYVDECLKALSAQDWDKICELIDVDSFIDYYIIQELYMNKDCFWRSVHFYKKPGGKLYAGPLWDMDQGLGNVTDLFGVHNKETTPTTDLGFESSTYNKTKDKLWIACANTWYRRLTRNEEFIELLIQRLYECGPIVMEIAKKAETDGTNPDSYYARYADAMERNFERWQIMGKNVWPNTATIVNIKTVKGQIDYMHDWLIERYFVICDYYGVPTDGLT